MPVACEVERVVVKVDERRLFVGKGIDIRPEVNGNCPLTRFIPCATPDIVSPIPSLAVAGKVERASVWRYRRLLAAHTLQVDWVWQHLGFAPVPIG